MPVKCSVCMCVCVSVYVRVCMRVPVCECVRALRIKTRASHIPVNTPIPRHHHLCVFYVKTKSVIQLSRQVLNSRLLPQPLNNWDDSDDGDDSDKTAETRQGGNRPTPLGLAELPTLKWFLPYWVPLPDSLIKSPEPSLEPVSLSAMLIWNNGRPRGLLIGQLQNPAPGQRASWSVGVRQQFAFS